MRSRRSIPASAGEPDRACVCVVIIEVYPRECGGTGRRHRETIDAHGLSPRVRGNQPSLGGLPTWAGSIPASAGEPRTAASPTPAMRVYPRECGGTAAPSSSPGTLPGLSPRVRGNRHVEHEAHVLGGSIPASAGEPGTRSPSSATCRVYPRECGGTPFDPAIKRSFSGLSPRVRGNPSRESRERSSGGSIPASAGEPLVASTHWRMQWVYPRECGGTRGRLSGSSKTRGLSPRVRGNRLRGVYISHIPGSIPASAGEPASNTAIWGVDKVYPRECGGTRDKRRRSKHRAGLSPRVRGNLVVEGVAGLADGSIPASAGEPRSARSRSRRARVYPRECGGTRLLATSPCAAAGLSPRVRGNLTGPVSVL